MSFSVQNSFSNHAVCFFKEKASRLYSVQNKTVMLIALAALGCLLLCYALFYSRSHTIKPVQMGNDEQEVGNDEQKAANLKDFLFNKVHSCQATKNLYDFAENELKACYGLPLQIRVVAPADMEFKQARCCHSTGEIMINSELSEDRAFACLLFELANMTQASKSRDILQKARTKELSREEFAFEIEKAEYDSVLIHTTIVKDAIAEKGKSWKKYDKYHSTALDPVKAFNLQIDTGHTESYMKAWDRMHEKKNNGEETQNSGD